MLKSIIDKAQIMGLHGEIITYQGAAIFDIDTEEIIYSMPISHDYALELIKFVEKDGYVLQAYYGHNFYIEKMNPFSAGYSSFCAVKPTIVNMKLSDYFEKKDIDLLKIVIILDDEKAVNKYIDILNEKFKDKFSFSKSYTNFLEVVNINASKGIAVKYLADRYGIKREEVMAFGDATNDNSMIEYAGLGVAVGNAMDELKEIADLVSDTCENDGVGKTIEKYNF
jgi:Cof subfamily protein (haloacid dehalogenase superfamily)